MKLDSFKSGKKVESETMSRFVRIIKQHTMPYLDIQKEIPSGHLRHIITTFSNHSGLCYAIMCGVSGAALLTPSDKLIQKENNNTKNKWMIISKYASKSIVPFFLLSFYFNLQGLMTSMMIAGHINAIPLKMVKTFVARHPFMIAMSGWCLVPGGGCLAAATLSYVHIMYDNQINNGLTYFAIILFSLFGLCSSVQTLRLLRSNVILRQKYRSDIINKKTNLQNVKLNRLHLKRVGES